MATKYLLNTATGAADGTSWADAYTTLASAFAGMSAGDACYMRDTHTEGTTVDTTRTSPGTTVSPCAVISVDASDNYSKASSSQFSAGNASGEHLTLGGVTSYYGVYFIAAEDIIPLTEVRFFDSTLKPGKTASTIGVIAPAAGSSSGVHTFKDVTLIKGTGALSYPFFNPVEPILLDGCSPSGYSNLYSNNSASTSRHSFTVANSDLSSLTGSVVVSNVSAIIDIRNCKLATPTDIIDNVMSSGRRGSISVESCDNGDTKQYYYYQDGWDTTEYNTTVSRAATDSATPFSTKIITKATQDHLVHSRRKIATMYVDTPDYATDITFTAHLAREDVAAVFDNKEVWIDIVHPDGDIEALGVEASTGVGILDTATNLTSTSGNWTGLGGTNQEMTIAKTITIGASAGNIASGVVEVWLNVAKASQTLYVCPRIDLT